MNEQAIAIEPSALARRTAATALTDFFGLAQVRAGRQRFTELKFQE